jgi:hypothetical protein
MAAGPWAHDGNAAHRPRATTTSKHQVHIKPRQAASRQRKQRNGGGGQRRHGGGHPKGGLTFWRELTPNSASIVASYRCPNGHACDDRTCAATHPVKDPDQCQYGDICYEAQCRYQHPPQRRVCAAGASCVDPSCRKLHPPSRPPLAGACPKRYACGDATCELVHPARSASQCRFRAKCFKPQCKLSHPAGRVLPRDGPDHDEEGRGEGDDAPTVPRPRAAGMRPSRVGGRRGGRWRAGASAGAGAAGSPDAADNANGSGPSGGGAGEWRPRGRRRGLPRITVETFDFPASGGMVRWLWGAWEGFL